MHSHLNIKFITDKKEFGLILEVSHCPAWLNFNDTNYSVNLAWTVYGRRRVRRWQYVWALVFKVR